MEGPLKRFKDENGVVYTVEQLMGFPKPIAAEILVRIPNILDLYNFANTSKRASEIMDEEQVFVKWNRYWVGENDEVMRMLMSSFDGKDLMQFTEYGYDQVITINYRVKNNEVAVFVRSGNEKLKKYLDRRGDRVGDSAQTWSLDVTSPLHLVQTLYTLTEFAWDMGLTFWYKKPVVEKLDRFNVLAFHAMCYPLFPPTRLEVRGTEWLTTYVADDAKTSFRPRFLELANRLREGYRMIVKFGKAPLLPNVKFVNCHICQEPTATDKCTQCNRAFHKDCWKHDSCHQ